MKSIKISFAVLIAAGLIVPLLLFLAIWAFLIEPNRLVVHEETISLPNWPIQLNKLKIAAISDIHAGSPFIDIAKLEQVVARTNQMSPDLIVLLGDFMVQKSWDKHRIEPEVIAGILKGLHARLGVFAVLGNHDWLYDGDRVKSALESVNIRVLENDVLRVENNGRALWLAGLADVITRPQNIDATIEKIPAGELVIALTHNPDIFPHVPSRVALTLAGHTHGGQVNLPLIGRLIVPSDYGQRYAAGHIEENGKQLFVTTGIGTSWFPVRFRVPPEIALVTIEAR